MTSMQTQKDSIHRSSMVSLLSEVRSMPYPVDVMEDRSGLITGTGFFPGATGLEHGSKPLLSRPIMVLGQDQDNQKGHVKSERVKNELYSKTWENMMALFKNAEIDLGECFFTNFIMGVRVNGRNTGPSPALAHSEFMQACSNFFIRQLQVQQPKVILCLGMIPFKLLALVSTVLRFRSIGIDKFQHVDARDMHMIRGVEFDALPGQDFLVVPLCHSSYKQNGDARKFSDKSGYGSEVDVLNAVRREFVNLPIQH